MILTLTHKIPHYVKGSSQEFCAIILGEVQVLSMERPILNLEYSRQVTEKNSVSNRDGLTKNIHDICYLRGRKSRLLCILDQKTYFSWLQKRVFNLVWEILFLAPEVLLQSLNHQRGSPAFGSKTHKAIWPYFVTFFLKVEPPCDQTWWDSLVFSIFSCFSYVVDAENTLVGPVSPLKVS